MIKRAVFIDREVAEKYSDFTSYVQSRVLTFIVDDRSTVREKMREFDLSIFVGRDARRFAGDNWADVDYLCVNFGSGNDRRIGCINVDVRPDVRAELIDDLSKCEFKFPPIKKAILFDVLEHFSWREVEKVFGRIVEQLARPGVLYLRVPAVERIFYQVVKRGVRMYYNEEYLELSYFLGGGQDYPENTHRTFFTRRGIKELMEKFGLKHKCVSDGGTNWQCVAIKR